MKKVNWLLASLAIVLIVSSPCYAVEWAITYGGSNWESAQSIRQTFDQLGSPNGYIVAGYTNTYGAGDYDFWVLKLDSDGDIIWEKTYGGGGSELAKSIEQTADGGYIVAGVTSSFGAGSSAVWVLKLDSNGDVIWQRTYGGSVSDSGYSIQQTTDGGYILAGVTMSFGAGVSDVWLLKLYPDGQPNAGDYGVIEWQRTYGGSGNDYAYSLEQTADGGYVLAGTTYLGSYEEGHWDVWLLKLYPDGQPNAGDYGVIEWQRTYGGDGAEYANSIQQTTDAGYIVAGTTADFPGASQDWWILKLNSNGDIVWQNAYDGRGDDNPSIQQTGDGGYIVAGQTTFRDGEHWDIWILKLNSIGAIIWQKVYGGYLDDDPWSVQQTTDGGYVVAGRSGSFGTGNNDLWVLQLDSIGEIPGCPFIGTSNATVSDTSATVSDTSVIPQESLAVPGDTNAIPQDTEAERSLVCVFPLCECNMIPEVTVIPREQTLGFQASVTNNTDLAGWVAFATHLTLPGGSRYPDPGWVNGPFWVNLNPYESVSGLLSLFIPSYAPLGTYTYNGYVGLLGPPPEVFDTCQFQFEVTE